MTIAETTFLTSAAPSAGKIAFKGYNFPAVVGLISAPALIAATTAGALGATFDTARWTPIVVTLDVPLGSQAIVMVTAEQGASMHWHCAYRGDKGATTPADGFSPLFRDLSTIVVVSVTRVTISLLPLGGWISDPEITPGVFVEAT